MRLVPVDTPEKISLCADVAAAIWREFYTPVIGAAQVAYMLEHFQSADAIAQQIKDEGYRYCLLYADDLPCGYFATVPEEDALKVSKLYVTQARRGKGAGHLMLRACAREAQQRGYKQLRLTVNRHSPSVGFYEHEGFVNAGPLVQQIGGGFVMDDYVMVKRLQP